MANWNENTSLGFLAHQAYREDGTYMSFVESVGSTDDHRMWDIYVEDPTDSCEFFMGEMEDMTPEDCMELAESVVLPDEATG